MKTEKQRFFAFSVAAALMVGTLFSCTETFAPSVDFGQRTYVNDYSALVAQVRNLVDKIDLLNKIGSDSGYSGIAIAIDKNTQAIIAQTEALNAQSAQTGAIMQEILKALLDGFTSLSTSYSKTGERIVNAIDNNGDVIRLALDENGKLVSASVITNANLIVAAINDSGKAIADRIKALNDAIEVGIAEIIISPKSSSGAQLVAQIKELCSIVEQLDKTILDGFSVVNDGLDLLGRRVVYAINSNGDVLRLSVDELGKVVSTAIEGQTSALVKVINDAAAPIADRINALSVIVNSNLATLNTNIGNVGAGLDVTVTGINDAIRSLGLAIFEGFRILSVTELQNGISIVSAINSNGERIRLSVDDLGNVISVGMDGIIESLNDLIEALEDANRTFEEKIDILNKAIKNGFNGLNVAVSDATGELSLQIEGINSTLFEGFKSIKKAVNTNGDNVVYAIDNQGKLIEALFDKAGCAISCKFKGVVSELVAAINGQTAEVATMGERLAALNSIVESGLAKVNCKIGNIGDKLDMRFESLNDAVSDLSLSLFYDFAYLGSRIDENGNNVVEAIDKLGNDILFVVDKYGNLISIKLDGIIGTLEDLIKVLESSERTLDEKFDALNDALAKGMEGVELSVNKLNNKLTLKLGDVNSTLLDGFKALETAVVTEGERILYAIGQQGEIISFHIDGNGALIKAAIEGSAAAIVDAINSQAAGLGDKIEALDKAVSVGLARVEVKLGDVGGMLDVKLTDLNDSVKGIKSGIESLLDGLQTISQSVDDNNNKIVEAINAAGEKLKLTIDNNGYLISIKLQGIIDELGKLRAFLESQDSGLGDKIDALNKAIQNGLEGIKGVIDLNMLGIRVTLGELESSVFDGFKLLADKQDGLGNTIAAAINKQGEAITVKIDEKGNLINATLTLGFDALVKAIKDQNADTSAKLEAINNAIKEGLLNLGLDIDDATDAIKLNTGALKNLDNDLCEGIGDVKDALDDILGGLVQLKNELNADGTAIVNALNKNGEIIQIQIKESGEIIEAAIKANTKDLVAALESATGNIEDKIGALNTTVETGLGNIEVSLDNQTGALTAGFEDLSGELEDINGNLLAGFEGVNESLDDIVTAINGMKTELSVKINANTEAILQLDADFKAELEDLIDAVKEVGGNIVVAVNEQGEAIVLALSKDGDLIKAINAGVDSIVNALAGLKTVLGDSNATLAAKLDALTEAIKDGFDEITLTVEGVNTTIHADFGSLETTLDTDLKAILEGLEDILGGLTTLNVTVGSNGEQIVTALNANGEAIKLQIDASGKLIKASLDDNTTALINALKDQNTSLEAKLDALGDIIEKGLGDIKVELGNLYQELKVDLGGLGDIIKEGFKGVTDGLTELKSEMNADGTAIVNAITGKGDLIQGQIDASGKLIEAAIKGNTTDIKTALEALGTSSQAVADKVDALNTTVGTGLGNIEAKIEAQTGEIKTGYTDLSGKLGTIGTNIFNGFNGTHTDLDAIKAAINGLKDQLTIDINANTQAILTLDGDFKDELGKLAAAVAKIGGDIVVAINGQKEAIVLALGPDGSIVKAVNAGAVKIVNAIEGQTTSLTALLNTGNGTLADILAALGTSGEDIADILAYMTEHEVDLSAIIELLGINNHLLTELLAISDGVYLDPEDKVGDNLYNYIYITADVRNAADNSDETAEALMSLLVGKSMAEPSKKQWCKTTPTSSEEFTEHSHCFWKKVNEAKPYLKYTNVTTDVDNKSLLKMEKYYSESYWELKIHDVCSYAHIYSIQINDARDMDHYVQYYKSELTQNEAGNKATWNKGYVNEKAGTTYMGPLVVKFVCYDKATGVYCEEPNVRVYCQLAGSGQGSSKDISPQGKCKDGTPYPDGTYSENMPDDGYWTSKPWTSLTKVGDTAIATFDK